MRILGKNPLTLLIAISISIASLLSASGHADYEEGWDAYLKEDFATAVAEIEPLAMQGDALAQNALGYFYQWGNGVLQDYTEAASWYRLSAEQGHAHAYLNLGFLHRDGKGVPQDYKEAVRLIRLAAEYGNSIAQWNLGRMYMEGEGVLQDYVTAHMWSNISAANGLSLPAGQQRDNLTELMTPSQVEKAQEMARICLNSGYVDCGE